MRCLSYVWVGAKNTKRLVFTRGSVCVAEISYAQARLGMLGHRASICESSVSMGERKKSGSIGVYICVMGAGGVVRTSKLDPGDRTVLVALQGNKDGD